MHQKRCICCCIGAELQISPENTYLLNFYFSNHQAILTIFPTLLLRSVTTEILCLIQGIIRLNTNRINRYLEKNKMALKEVPPLTKEQYKFVVDTLQKEEKNPSKARISRIKAARIRAANMKVVYH